MGRSVIIAALLLFAAVSCGFGVSLDGLFGAEEGTPHDAAVEATVDSGTDIVDAPYTTPDAEVPKVKVVQIATGSGFACARREDGTVMCWGRGTEGRLGDGNAKSSSSPVLVHELTDAIDLSVGGGHACVIRSSGAVYCWGQNDLRQVGNGTTSEARTPQPVVQITDAIQVVGGGWFTCALRKDRTVWCWGDNSQGQLGDNSILTRVQPVPVQGLTDVTQLALASTTGCALKTSGEVYCWGDNDEGQIGSGSIGTDALVPSKVQNLSGVASIAAGGLSKHICAVLTSGSVRCWGSGDSGCLGNGTTQDSAVPVAVLGVADAVRVTANTAFTCALRNTGSASCWGTNLWRTLGVGEIGPSFVSAPVPVAGLAGAGQLAAAPATVCALSTDGSSIWCWGGNQYGSLGRNTALSSDVPVKAVTTQSAAMLALGREHGCIIDDQRALSCWGLNSARQQTNTTFAAVGAPTLVAPIADVVRAAGGDAHSCAVIGDGGVRCWGSGDDGALGTGSSNWTSAPAPFLSGTATDVGAGYRFTCALLASTRVACAGRNDDGRIGRSGGSSSTPTLVVSVLPDAGAGPPLDSVDKLAVGRYHSCVIHGANRLSCWGTNSSSQLGFSGSARSAPFEVALPSGATDVAVGGRHTCAVLTDGSVRCWGNNGAGQSSGTDPSGPALRTPDLGGKSALAITAGDDHTCALTNDKTVLCWGAGAFGQLGNGARLDSSVPVAVTSLTNVSAIAADENRTCAITDMGLYCWGSNISGQLGVGVVMTTGIPGNVEGY